MCSFSDKLEVIGDTLYGTQVELFSDHKSLKFLLVKGFEYKAKEMDGVSDKLLLRLKVPSEKGKCSNKRFEYECFT